MNRNRIQRTAIAVGGALAATVAAQAALVGQWDFNDGNLNSTVGQPMTYAGFTVQPATQFGTTTALGLPDIGGQPATVMGFPATQPFEGYNIPVPGAANGGGGLVNQWTLILDVLYPTASDAKWRSIIETDGTVINQDADLFVNPGNGIGISGNYSGTVSPNTWHRIAFVIDQADGVNQIRKYIDGAEVGIQGAGGVDGRWALSPGAPAQLFTDNDGDVAPGFVNSVQIYDTPLSKGVLAALGAPTATGLPTTLPPVPTFVERWIPSGGFTKPGANAGIVLNNEGGNTLSGVTMTFDGASVTPNRTDAGGLVTLLVPNPNLQPRTEHTLIVGFNDGVSGARSFTNNFRVPILFEDFEDIVLGPNVDEGLVGEAVFSATPPAGWTVDNSLMPTNIWTGESWATPGIGVTEFKGWNFMNKDWWVATAGDQSRSQFTLASGTVAVADPDEWDDLGNPDGAVGYFNSTMVSLEVDITGVAPGSISLNFVSSFRPEANDDRPPTEEGPGTGEPTNDQTAVVRVSYDGAAPVELLRWNAATGKTDSQNEAVALLLANPAGATKAQFFFDLLNAGNDWWWSVDNIAVDAGSLPPPEFTSEPADATTVEGQGAVLASTTTGAGVEYQWFFGDDALDGATAATLSLGNLRLNQAGGYKVVASNSGGSVTSRVAQVTILPKLANNDSLKNGLWTYLPFDGNYNDASGNNLNASAVGSPTFVAGAVGSGAMLATTVNAETTYNYATLGTQLNLAPAQNFSVSLWVKISSLSGDPGLLGNKDWNSGGNPGFVLFTTGARRARWNYRNADSPRIDSNVPPEAFPTDVWGHMVVTYDRAGNASTYVNGNLIDVRALGPVGTVFQAEGLNLNIGQDGTGTYGSDQVAAYDEVALWNRVLTQQEVAAVYQAGAAGRSFTVNPPAGDVSVGASLVEGAVALSWTGGSAPYLVQFQPTLGGTWIDLATTSDTALTVPVVGTGGFFRVESGTSKTVTLYTASLSGGQEVPAVTTTGTGAGYLALQGDVLTYYVAFEGLTGNVSAAHLHGPAAAGANAGVFFHLLPSPNFPADTRAGVLTGQQTLTAEQKTAVDAGNTYVNVHTSTFGGGEVRGQVVK